MKIVVMIKQVADNTKLKFNDGKPALEGVPLMMNPFDEYALETALRLKEQAGGDSTVTAISLGSAGAKDTLKKAVAAGADEAILLSDANMLEGDSFTTAQALAKAVQQFASDARLIIFGQVALDDANGQVGPMVAELLGWASTTFGKNAQIQGESALITRETERGSEVINLPLPAVACMMKCDYELRSANIKGVMKANKTEIPVKSAADLSLESSLTGKAGAKVEVLKTWQRPAKAGGKVVDGSDAKTAVNELLAYLKEAKVL